MDMCRERLSVGWLLRLGLVLTAVCLCILIYLDARWQAALAPLVLGGPTQSNKSQKSRLKPGSAEAHEQDTGVKRELSYAHTLDGSTKCCPPLHPHKKTPRWRIELQPWASENQSLEDEAKRFLRYITTPQVSCASLPDKKAAQEGSAGGWAVCLHPKYSLIHRIRSKRCRVYSFGLGVDDWSLERFLAGSGCEVHGFDPSLKQLHLQEAGMWLHRLSLDWRDPNPAVVAQRQYANSKKMATILNDFGHREVDVIKADMESAEWKILENLILEGVLDSVGQLLLEIHLHWAGFEVGGDDPSVVRYWFSVLKELERANFLLFHAHRNPSKPQLFLHKHVLNASSAYTLSWVNAQWKS
ncbi:probable methyltransferase-like protein 24 isoform X1 [Cololabis saira]|uniref:probable methyltransferase-like protein 24 isoform X1 n=1 Tax=Cololabis saira TaxID=129043 RepID=UPI002AD45D21|nr:probable methyltransferase-like protein 24 isoform X1 [Cololabis saira]